MQTERTTRRTTDVPRDVPPADHVRLTVAQAAERLGITRGAVRSRIKRGTLPTAKEAGRVYVVLGDGTPQANHAHDADEPTGEPSAQRGDPLVEELREQLAYLRQELAAERNAHAETRRIAYALAQRVPELEAAQETRESPQTTGEDAEGVREPLFTEEAQEAAQPRSWWRRFFGFE